MQHSNVSLWKPGCVEPVAGIVKFRNCRKIIVQFSCLNSISWRDFYEFLQKRESVLHHHALGQNRCNQQAGVTCGGGTAHKQQLASVVKQEYS